jgi:predicted kinase
MASEVRMSGVGGLPTLVVVSGPGGSGKTTLAHLVAGAIGCPAVCRDEIKEGMVHATPGFVPSPGDALTQRTVTTFFGVIELLLRAGATLVAEAAFQDPLWRSGLDPLADLADIRVLRCTVSPELARARMTARLAGDPRRGAAHADLDALEVSRAAEGPFEHVRLAVRTLCVDTTSGYRPALEEIVAFINEAAGGQTPGDG